MSTYNGTLLSLDAAMHMTTNRLDEAVRELEALHQLFDRMLVPKWSPTTGHQMLLAQRLEWLLEAPKTWEGVHRKEDQMGG